MKFTFHNAFANTRKDLNPACKSLIRRFIKTGITMLYSILVLGTLTSLAQPSGGPYGPIRQNYALPEVEGKIYYVSPEGDAEEPGTSLDNPTSIEAAIKNVVTGDAIVMCGGTYRTGSLLLNQGITMQAYADEQPVLKGTYIADEWTDLGNGLWETSWSRLFPSKPDSWWRREREGKKTPQHRFNNDMVFVDGRFLQSAGWEGEVDENSFYIDYDAQKVTIGIDPANRLVEITAFNVGLHRVTGEVHGKKSDGKGPLIRGIVFTQYAYRAIEIDGTEPDGISDEADHGKEVIGTSLEHCEISYCSRVAAYIRGDKLTLRNCKVSNTSTEGIYIIASSDVLLEKNIFASNNIERITGYFPAAVKIFNQSYRVTCNDNLVMDHPYSNGIWYDVGNVDGVFTNNYLVDIGNTDKEFVHDKPWPSDNAFFFEISKGAICAGNVFVNCDQGIFVLNSSDVKIYNNTLVNSTVAIGRNERVPQGDHFGWHSSTGPGVEERDGHVFVNNLLTGDENYNRPLLFVWQRDFLCDRLPESMIEKLDHNVYIKSPEEALKPLILWSPANNTSCQQAFASLEEFRKLHTGFSKNSLYFHNNETFFKSPKLGNFQLLPTFPGSEAAAILPADVRKVLGQTDKSSRYLGAYPLVN